MTATPAPKSRKPTTKKKAAATQPAHLGRKPMFKDDLEVVKILREVSNQRKVDGDTCTLHNLKAAVMKNPDLFAPNIKSGVEVAYSPGAVKQAIYRLVREHNIWISRNGK